MRTKRFNSIFIFLGMMLLLSLSIQPSLAKIDAVKKFPIWKTITLGNFKDLASLQQALGTKDFWGSADNELLEKTPFSPNICVVNLVKLKLSNLGFKNPTSIPDIYARAEKFGFRLCPAEVGPQLRLQYLNQPRNQHLFIAMKPLECIVWESRGQIVPTIFMLSGPLDEEYVPDRIEERPDYRHDRFSLRYAYSGDNVNYHAHTEWIFVKGD